MLNASAAGGEQAEQRRRLPLGSAGEGGGSDAARGAHNAAPSELPAPPRHSTVPATQRRPKPIKKKN